MKFLSVLFASSILLASSVDAHEFEFTKNDKFRVQEKQYRFSTYFEMDSERGPVGTIVKSALNWRAVYDLYSPSGVYEASGYKLITFWGFFGTWGADIEVYDSKNKKIGLIDGQAMTTTTARYNLWDKNDVLVGIAYLDDMSAGFTIVDPNNENRWIARLNREFIQDAVDEWEVKIYDHKAIDPRMIKIFAGFAIDYQEYFKADN